MHRCYRRLLWTLLAATCLLLANSALILTGVIPTLHS